MVSRLSGPIPSHDVYFPTRASLRSSRGTRTGSIGLSGSRFSGSMNALDLLQWQANRFTTEFNSTVNFTGQPVKNYIRENIRRLRQMRATPAVKLVPHASSVVPFVRMHKTSPESPVLVDTMPPRPHTAMPRCPHVQGSDRPLLRAKTTSTDATSVQLPDDQGELYLDECTGDTVCLDCYRPTDPDPLPPHVNRPSSPDQVTPSRSGSVGVQCRATQCSLESQKPHRRHSTHSRGVQAAPTVDHPTQTRDSDLVSLANDRKEQTQRVEKTLNTEQKRKVWEDRATVEVMTAAADKAVNGKRSRLSQPTRERPRVLNRAAYRSPRPVSAGPVRHEFMRAHSNTIDGEWNLKALSSMPIRKVNRSPRPDQLTVPKASSAKSVQLIRRDINFVRANAHLASATNSRAQRARRAVSARVRSPAPSEEPPRPESSQHGDARNQMWPQRRLPVGSLPTYLIRRRQEQRDAATKAAANQPDPDQPPGHQKMPEAERRNTLELLQKAHRELADEWASLPIRMDTMRIRNRRTELEQRLADLEQAISIFNKPKVFIKPE